MKFPSMNFPCRLQHDKGVRLAVLNSKWFASSESQGTNTVTPCLFTMTKEKCAEALGCSWT